MGALALACTMNLRQVISILMSYIMYSHPITFLQTVGLVVVFSALGYKSYLGFATSKPNHAEVTKEPSDVEKQKPQAEIFGKPIKEMNVLPEELEEIIGSRN